MKGTCQKELGKAADGTALIGLEATGNYCQEHGCPMCFFKKKGKIEVEGKKICKVCGGQKRKEINDWISNEKSLDEELKKISQDFYTAIYPVKASIFSFKKGILEKQIEIEELKTIFSLIENNCPSLDTKEKSDWKAIYQGIGKKKSELINKVFPTEKYLLLNLAWKRKHDEKPAPSPNQPPPSVPPNNPPQPNTSNTPNPTPNQPNNDQPNNNNPAPKQSSPSPNQFDNRKNKEVYENKENCEICDTLSNDLALFMKTSELIVYFPKFSQIYLQEVPEKFHVKVKEINGLFALNEKEAVKKVAQEKGINNLTIGQMACPSCYKEIEQNQKEIFEPENEKNLGENATRGVKAYQELRKELEKEIGKEKLAKLDKKVKEFLKRLKQRENEEKDYKQINQKEEKIPTRGILILIIIGIVVVIIVYYLMNKKKKRKLTQFTLAN
jgi:hypothetical protein